MTWIILWITDRTVGLRVSPGDEETGLDLSEHAEAGYQPIAAAASMTSDGMAALPGTQPKRSADKLPSPITKGDGVASRCCVLLSSRGDGSGA